MESGHAEQHPPRKRRHLSGDNLQIKFSFFLFFIFNVIYAEYFHNYHFTGGVEGVGFQYTFSFGPVAAYAGAPVMHEYSKDIVNDSQTVTTNDFSLKRYIGIGGLISSIKNPNRKYFISAGIGSIISFINNSQRTNQEVTEHSRGIFYNIPTDARIGFDVYWFSHGSPLFSIGVNAIGYSFESNSMFL